MDAKKGLAGVGVGLGACVLALAMVMQQLTAMTYRQGGASQSCQSGSTQPSGVVDQADVSSVAQDEIPTEMLELYQNAAEAWEMDWAILASVGYQESTHNTNQAVDTENHAQALGPMQFTPPAWEHHGRYWGDLTGKEGTPPLEDRLDPDTSVWSAAYKLTDQGVNGDPEGALIAYYGADTDGYVDSVMSRADRYRDGEFSSGTGGEIVMVSADCPEEGTGIPGEAPNYSVEDLMLQTRLEPCIVDNPPFSTGDIRALTCAAHKNFVENFGPRLDFEGNCLRSGGGGDHPRGLACDYMTSPGGTYSTGSQEELGDMIAEHAITNAETLGVKYVIWRQSIWNAGWSECPAHRTDRNEPWYNNVPDLDGGKWCTMNSIGNVTDDHYDHVHISYIG